ncbi:MAG: hypothetical protein LQ349_005797 [Xanthoria aureola]|nr:MAG: hypothetical protein LQ349_005797 [Xanthoria aureola]
MRSLMLILVCALSVSARCVKKSVASTKSNVVQKAGANKVSSQAGPGRKLLEDSSAGSEELPSLTNTTTTTFNQSGQSTDQQGSSDTQSSGSSDKSGTDQTSATSNDDSNKDTSNTEDPVPSSIPSSGPGDTSSTGNNDKGKDTSSTDTSSTSSGGSSNTSSSTHTSSSSGGGGSGSCGAMKNVCFNGGMNPSMFDKMESASHWITFGLDIPGGSPSPRAKQAHIPMMAFEKHVSDTVKLVNGPDAPEWVLTFNEPDYSYMGWTPTMDGKTAAAAIAPLLAQPGSKTKYVAPATADPNHPFLEEFFAACNCKDFFSAYNIHSYNPDSAATIKAMDEYHGKWNDKPLWITELAPGGGCGKSPETVGQFFKDMFKFAKNSGYIDKVFWNTGNQIDAKDSNVCDSWLVDGSGKPGPLMDIFNAIDCS